MYLETVMDYGRYVMDYGRHYGYGRECAGIMAENVEYNGTELISEIFIANGFVCCGKAGQDD